MSILYDSPTIIKYKNTMSKCIQMYYKDLLDPLEINKIMDYSINKRYKENKCKVVNNYKKVESDFTLLAVSDYIASREPIVTAFGTMFKKHADVPNPLGAVVQSFLDKRKEDKAMMFKFPRGSEMFEKYNLLQLLDKIDGNGIYGVLGMASSLIYNINVASSITSQGRALVSSMTLFFEAFLADNVKFGSLNEVVEFINNIVQESSKRKFNDFDILDKDVSLEDCFAKIILDCGYRWIPDEKEMDIIWKLLQNLSREDLNRVYYKNNLYEFVSNSKVLNLVKKMIRNLKAPMYNSVKAPKEIQDDIKLFSDLLYEYVYYRYMFIDRIGRCDNMIKSVTMISDTDSTIVSLDAWYRFIVNEINGEELRIANYCKDPILFMEKDEDGDWTDKEWMQSIEFTPKRLDYNFNTDELIEIERESRPNILTPNDNVRYSIINIMGFVIDRIVNDYMEKFCENNHSLTPDRDCKIIAKNEYLFRRVLMTTVKKNYASIMEIQEGNMVPFNKQLDIKGIECLTKSSAPLSTRNALKKILLEDILRAPVIDQLRIVKDIAIFEKQIINALRNGSKEYFKPVTIKSISAYEDPMRIQGIKASYAWNLIKPASAEAINLDERNAIYVIKVEINKATIDKIKDKYPEVYNNMLIALGREEFNDGINAIAIPLETETPDWLFDFIDFNSILNDNVSGFPLESVGIQRFDKGSINYSNIVKF